MIGRLVYSLYIIFALQIPIYWRRNGAKSIYSQHRTADIDDIPSAMLDKNNWNSWIQNKISKLGPNITNWPFYLTTIPQVQ